MIYKILTRLEWEHARANGSFNGSRVDLEDGFIHFSSPTQVQETAARHFAGQDHLVLLGVDEKALDDNLKWEISRNGEPFPHLYSNLDLQYVCSSFELTIGADGKHIFPEL